MSSSTGPPEGARPEVPIGREWFPDAGVSKGAPAIETVVSGETTWSPRRGAAALALILAVAAAMIGVAYVRERIPWNSDSAVVALMARDIAHHGARPVFFDGSQYAGTLEQFYLASAFRIFPETVTTQRVAIAALLLAVIVFVWLLTRETFGERAALIGGLYLALGPPFFFYRGLTSEGPYTPIYLIGAAILFLLARIEARSLSGRSPVPEVLAVGLLGGLGWWTHPLVLVFGACALAALFAGTARRRLTVWSVGGSVLALTIGVLPWLVANVHSGWASLRGPEFARASGFQIHEQLDVMLRVGFPTLLGGRSVWAVKPLFPGSTAMAYGELAVLVVFGATVLASRCPFLQRYCTVILLTLVLVTPALALSARRADLREPRLLFPLYFALAPLFGALLTSRAVARWLKGALCVGVAGLHLAAHAAAPRFDPPPLKLVEGLRQRSIHAVYASYWTAYQVTFLSGGDLVGTPFGLWNLTRRSSDRAKVDRSPSPGFVLDPDEGKRFEAFLTNREWPYRRDAIGRYLLFAGLPQAALVELRRCECIPPSPRRVTWLGIEGPHLMPSGATARYRVRVRNDAPEAWSPQMNFSYRWVRRDGTVAVFDGLRTRVERPPAPGETLDAEVTVEADLPAGNYILVIDVVEEGVAWFADLGVAPLKYDVEIL